MEQANKPYRMPTLTAINDMTPLPPKRRVSVKVWLTQGEKAILDSKCNREAMSISGWLRREITKTNK